MRLSTGSKMIDELKSKGIRILGWYMTLGRYDAVLIYEAENEKEALKMCFAAADLMKTETLVAIPREEAKTLL
jgi:uncharacterized protein with GYD domain